MADQATTERKGIQGKIDKVTAINPVVGGQLQNLYDLSKALDEGKSQEEKDLERLIASTSSQEIAARLQEELERIQGGKGVDLDEAFQVIQANGMTVSEVIIAGTRKKIGSKAWTVMNSVKKAAEETGSEDPESEE